MSRAVLDASAILALLHDEPGAAVVAGAVADAVVSTVNLSEVVAHFARGGLSAPMIQAILGELPIEQIPFDEDQAWAAGLLSPQTRPAGLSLGDRACLALASRLGVRALTADRSWARIAAAAGIEIEVIR